MFYMAQICCISSPHSSQFGCRYIFFSHLRPEIDVVCYFEHQFEGMIHFKRRMIDLGTLILYRYLPHLSVRRKNPTSTFILCLSRYQMLGPEMPYSKRVLLNCTILALFNLFIPKNAHLFHSKVILS